jgi:hypothetical protein
MSPTDRARQILVIVATIGFLICIAVAYCSGCGGSTPAAKTVPDIAARVGYESARIVWLWADAQTAAEHRIATDLIIQAVHSIKPDLERQCGERWKDCAVDAARGMLTDWEAENSYRERAERLEVARRGLVLWEAYISDPVGQPNTRAVIRDVTWALIETTRDLERRGAVVPKELQSALLLVQTIAGGPPVFPKRDGGSAEPAPVAPVPSPAPLPALYLDEEVAP